MQSYNFEIAYLTREDGVICIRQSGDVKNRIDLVSVVVDLQNVLTIAYNVLHYRMNSITSNKSYLYLFGSYFRSTYSPKDVLEEYLEITTYEEERFFCKKIEHKELLPKKGLIRLNKIPYRVEVKTTGNYLIEKPHEPLTGTIYSKFPII